LYILGIETSCDETAAAVVDSKKELSNVIATQTIHAEYGGVVPEFASRAHIKQLLRIIAIALQEAKSEIRNIEALAVTYGPGLAGSLLVGLNVAKAMAFSLSLPYIGVNHIEGHIFAALQNHARLSFPFLCLVVSGGHTLLVHVMGVGKYRVMGQTIDDAAGEAFDKVAKILGLSYPGGPAIEKNARHGDPARIAFPRALIAEDNFDFSFSGLKTAVLYYVNRLSDSELKDGLADIAASFQAAVVDVLISKAIKAAALLKVKEIVLVGGVARNGTLRSQFEATCKERGLGFYVPRPDLCTDNALMIARVGYEYLSRGKKSAYDLMPQPSLELPLEF